MKLRPGPRDGKHRGTRQARKEGEELAAAAASGRRAPAPKASVRDQPLCGAPLRAQHARAQNVPPAPAEKAATAHAHPHARLVTSRPRTTRTRRRGRRKARAATPAPVRGGGRPNLSRQRKDDPDPPPPPGQQPPAPVEEPPHSPQSDPPAPVREPGPTPPTRMQACGADRPRQQQPLGLKPIRFFRPYPRTKVRGFHRLGRGFSKSLNSSVPLCLCGRFMILDGTTRSAPGRQVRGCRRA